MMLVAVADLLALEADCPPPMTVPAQLRSNELLGVVSPNASQSAANRNIITEQITICEQACNSSFLP